MPANPSLSIRTDLVLSGPGGDLKVIADGGRIVCRATHPAALVELARSGPGGSWRRLALERLDRGLRLGGLTLELQLGSRPCVRIGSAARRTAIGRWLGVPGEVLPAALLVWLRGIFSLSRA